MTRWTFSSMRPRSSAARLGRRSGWDAMDTGGSLVVDPRPSPRLRRTGDQLAIRAPFEPDPPFVREVMMPPAKEGQVENQRRPTIRPMLEMVTLRPGPRPDRKSVG